MKSLQKIEKKNGNTLLHDRKTMVGYFTRGIFTVVRHHKCNKELAKLLVDSLKKYFLSPNKTRLSESKIIKEFKYIQQLPMTLYLNEPEPERPETYSYEFPKEFKKKFMRSRLAVFKNNNTHLWFSWLQTKRSCLEVSDNFVAEAYMKHMDSMTKNIGYREGMVKDVIEQLRPVLTRIRKRLHPHALQGDYCSTQNYMKDLEDLNYDVSSSACLDLSRSEGGPRGYFRRNVFSPSYSEVSKLEHEYEDLNTAHDVYSTYAEAMKDNRSLYRMDYNCSLDGVNRPHTIVSVYKDFDCDTELKDYLVPIMNDIHNRRKHLQAKVRGIIEPLKVRTITCGRADEYFLAKKFQKDLFAIMKSIPCFNLIGQRVTGLDLENLKSNTIFKNEDNEWFSVDYSAATDELDPRLSRAILSEITSGMDNKIRHLLMKVNGAHDLYYPPLDRKKVKKSSIKQYEKHITDLIRKQQLPEYLKFRTEEKEMRKNNQLAPKIRIIDAHYNGDIPIRQINGQLMGNPVSFLILCLANLGLYLYNTRNSSTGLDIKIDQKIKSVKINGDDKLFYAPRSFCLSIQDNGRGIGLANSPGKSYIHPIYANINSMCFHSDPQKSSRPIPFLNTGLFFNQHKVMRVTGEEMGECKLIGLINELLAGCRDDGKDDILSSFLKRFKKEISLEQAFLIKDKSTVRQSLRVKHAKDILELNITCLFNNYNIYDELIKDGGYDLYQRKRWYKHDRIFLEEENIFTTKFSDHLDKGYSMLSILDQFEDDNYHQLSDQSISENYRLLRSVWESQKNLAKQQIKLKKLNKRRFFKNLFIPCNKGGFGVTLPETFNNNISIKQRKLADQSPTIPQRPLKYSDYCKEKRELFSPTPWFIPSYEVENKKVIDLVSASNLASDKRCYNPFIE